MASLLGLPNELLLIIFENLGDLDDVVHLERTCQQLHALIEHRRNRLIIFRAVICRAEHHRYDIRLCYCLQIFEEYSNFSCKDPPHSAGLEVSTSKSSLLNRIHELGDDRLPDELVWMIACRWQSLRVLQDIYTHPSVHDMYLRSTFRSGPVDQNEPSPPFPCRKQFTKLSSTQTQRFYQALTAIWLAIESTHMSGTGVASLESWVSGAQMENHWRMARGSLEECLDMVEIYDFFWGYLPAKIFGEIDLWTRHYTSESAEVEFYDRLKEHLKPSNIVELLLLSLWGDGSWPPDRRRYLTQMVRPIGEEFYTSIIGEFDNPYSAMKTATSIEIATYTLTIKLVESMRQMYRADYRGRLRKSNACGNVFEKGVLRADFRDHLLSYVAGSRYILNAYLTPFKHVVTDFIIVNMPIEPASRADRQPGKGPQDGGDGDEEEDYMSMAFLEESQAKKETFAQKKLRKQREAEEKSRVPSKAELAAAEAARREAALATSTIGPSNKGFRMMQKLGYKPGSALGKKSPAEATGDEVEQRLKEPLGISVKENRGGIGHDTEKKRKFREELEGEAKRVKAVESDYLERMRTEREEKRQEAQFHAAQKVLERFESEDGMALDHREVGHDDSTTTEESKTRRTRPIARVNVLYRGLVRARETKLREQQALRRRYESLSSRDSSQLYSEKIPGLPTIADDELEVDDKLALGRTAEGEVVETEADEEEDEELEQFNALGVQERLSRAVVHLRDKYNYCFWCKYRYESADMEGCPGLTEEDHD